jgi:neutral ceramidase
MASKLTGAAAAVRITPPLGTSLAGYFTDRKAEGVYDDLYASAIVLDDGGSRVVLVACDLCYLTEEMALPIRRDIAARAGVPLDSVLISSTHTHTGPVTEGPLADMEYLKDIQGKIADAAVEACAHLAPWSPYYGSGTDCRFAFNRRYLMKDGSVMTNPGLDNPAVVGPAGTVDHSVNVLTARDKDGRTAAVLVNTACHPDTVDGNLISADWPGALRDTIRKSVGADIPVLVLNGPAGDVNHFDVMGRRIVQNIAEARRIGSGYGATAIGAMSHSERLSHAPLGVFHESVAVPCRRFRDSEIAEAKKTVAALENDPEARLEGHLESQDIARGSKAVRFMFARILLEAAAKAGGSKKLEMSLVRVGALGMYTVNGELFTDIGLAVKKEGSFRHSFVAELVNGLIGYLGTKLSYRQGGYETLSGNRVCDEAEDYILEAARRLARRGAAP